MRITEKINKDWRFRMLGEEYVAVDLPHTLRLEDLDCDKPLQGIAEYEKVINIPLDYKDKLITLHFEGAMSVAEVFVNGISVLSHFGGYLPFYVSIEKYLKFGSANTIKVVLDNRDSKNVPPGKPTGKLDFLYYGGIYRSVWMIVTEKLHINHAIMDNNSKHGITIKSTFTQNVAVVDIYTGISSKLLEDTIFKLKTVIKFQDGQVVKIKEKIEKIGANSDGSFFISVLFEEPKLWDIENPHLYTAEISIFKDDLLIDLKTVKFGVRNLEVRQYGVYLNDRLIRLNGANRHHQYPFVGIAASDEQNFRDAYKLKQLGFNIIRAAHYPQSDAFLNACDELGLLVIDCIPGWQFCKFGKFRKILVQNLKDLVMRDRNHPCILAYETSLNETPFTMPGASDRFYIKLKKLVQKIQPGGYTCGDTLGRSNPAKIDYDIPFTGYDDKTMTRPLPKQISKLGLTREYGDWEFGGHYSLTRADRSSGEQKLQIQAWNFQWSHNLNKGSKFELGDIIWEGIDHTRGYDSDAPISTSGVLDIFRYPKISAMFYKSQKPFVKNEEYVLENAFFDINNKEKLAFYSNLDRLELYDLQGNLIESKCHDNGEDCKYMPAKDVTQTPTVAYWLNDSDNHLTGSEKESKLAMHTISCMFDGGNCRNLEHPPFTFSGLNKSSEGYKIVGYSKNEVIVEKMLYPVSEGCEIVLEADMSGRNLKLYNNDFIFVYAIIKDMHNNTADYNGNVKLTVIGGECLKTDTVKSNYGVASFALKATEKDLTIVAECGNLRSKPLNIAVDE